MIPSQKYRTFFISIHELWNLFPVKTMKMLKTNVIFESKPAELFFLLLRTENENNAYQIVQNFHFSSQKLKKIFLSLIYVFSWFHKSDFATEMFSLFFIVPEISRRVSVLTLKRQKFSHHFFKRIAIRKW